jgi:shikimate kinase
MSRIFLVGNAAAGKTTFGRALAKRLAQEFVDLDNYIENRYHTTINEIFAAHGEEYFRQVEASMLREVGEFEDVVIACGGGTPCHKGNMEWMNAQGMTVWVMASRQRIVERLMRNRSRRPMFRDLDRNGVEMKVDAVMREREHFYAAARIHFSGEELEDRRQITKTVETFIAQYLPTNGTTQR